MDSHPPPGELGLPAPAGGAPPHQPRILTDDALPSERKILFLLGAVQFVNILDFMMVMPLGPDFAKALDIAPDKLGLIGGSYTAAAAIAGLVGSRFLDRFDRRNALAVAMLGLVSATALGGLARGMASLMAARMMAGAFGGPATSLSLSILADVVPPQRRGKALGAVMGAFSAASVLGVPAGLWLAQVGSWRTPFLCVAALGLVVAGSAVAILPSLRLHLDPARRVEAPPSRKPLWARRTVLLSWTASLTVMLGNFALIPYLSPYIQFNLGYPRNRLGLLYMVGGTVSFVAMRAVGWLADKFGEVPIAAIGTGLLEIILLVGFVVVLPIPVPALFVGYMLSSSFRMVPMSSITSKVPLPWERAQFMSIQSAVQHLASASGAVLASTIIVSTSATAPIAGIPKVAAFNMVLAFFVPFLLWRVKAGLPVAAAPPRSP
jgi:predicted MFS family arabinose efflux permease